MRRFGLSVLALLFLVGSAAAGPAAPSAGFRDAPGFSVERRGSYEVLKVLSPWPGAPRGFTYILYPRGSKRPAGLSADGFFEVPLRRVVVFSTTYIPMIVELGETESVVGVDAAAAVYSPAIRGRIAAGLVAETARNGNPDVERLIALKPDAVFAYGMGNEWDIHPKLAEAGLPVVVGAEWNETDPLARAAWIEFVGAFYGKEAEAEAMFERVASEYEAVRAAAAGAPERPKVLVNGPFQGTWTVSGGGSYMARFLADAGADYLWADDRSTGGLVLSVEAVYRKARAAEFWLNPAIQVETRADLLALDPRLASLPAVREGKVWNGNLRMSPGGGSDYFESAVVNPDKVLVDLVKIFHPGLLADRSFTYYRNVGK